MDPVNGLVTALAAGAAAAATGVASDAVNSLYAGLKKAIAGRLASLATIEEDPRDPDYQAAARKEVARKGLAAEPAVQESAARLGEALERESAERLASWGIDIGEIRSARGVIVRNLESSGGGVRVRGIEASGGDVEVSGVRSAIPPKNG